MFCNDVDSKHLFTNGASSAVRGVPPSSIGTGIIWAEEKLEPRYNPMARMRKCFMIGSLSHHTLDKDLNKLAHAAEDAFADFTGTQDAGAVAEALEDVVSDGFLFAVDVRFHEGPQLKL